MVHGNATAGGAYQPGLSDYVVVVRERAKMFLAGPPLLKAATGEIATDEELGGAEMHAGTAGTAEYLAQSDGDGISQARDLVKLLGWRRAAATAPEHEEPKFPPEELLGVVPADAKKPYDVRESSPVSLMVLIFWTSRTNGTAPPSAAGAPSKASP